MTNYKQVAWVVEPDAFSESYSEVCEAIRGTGQPLIRWKDDWWSTKAFPDLSEHLVIFHGSLGNADRIVKETPWTPGAFCATEAFRCSAWYERAKQWLLLKRWVFTTVEDFVADPETIAGHLAKEGKIFVRPESPLKPFSGRVRTLEGLTLEDLDYGFYYEDASIPIVVAPVAEVGREWRFVVADQRVVAGSEYEANTRSARLEKEDIPWQTAQKIAAGLEPPELVYVMDLCESGDELRLLELNPFSGADLYGCEAEKVIRDVSKAILDSTRSGT